MNLHRHIEWLWTRFEIQLGIVQSYGLQKRNVSPRFRNQGPAAGLPPGKVRPRVQLTDTPTSPSTRVSPLLRVRWSESVGMVLRTTKWSKLETRLAPPISIDSTSYRSRDFRMSELLARVCLAPRGEFGAGVATMSENIKIRRGTDWTNCSKVGRRGGPIEPSNRREIADVHLALHLVLRWYPNKRTGGDC